MSILFRMFVVGQAFLLGCICTSLELSAYENEHMPMSLGDGKAVLDSHYP